MNDIIKWLKALESRIDKLAAQVVRQTIAPSLVTVTVKAINYTLLPSDNVVVFTATGTTATLPPATGSGQNYRIAFDDSSGTMTVDGDGTDTIKGALTQTLTPGDDLIITDYAAGKWA